MAQPRDTQAEYRRRTERAKAAGFTGYGQLRHLGGTRQIQDPDASDLTRIPRDAEDIRRVALKALSRMRAEDLTVSQAARREGISPEALRFWANPALVAGEPIPSDSLLRPIQIASRGRAFLAVVPTSTEATLASRYHAAIGLYGKTGDASGLRTLRGQTIAGHVLETRPRAVLDLIRSGAFDIDDIYGGLAT